MPRACGPFARESREMTKMQELIDIALTLFWGILGFALFLSFAYVFIRDLTVGSRPFELAMTRLRESSEAVEALGEPIEAGRPLSRNLQYNFFGGFARYDVPIQGSRATANLYVKGRSFFGPWRFSELKLGVHHGPILDLRNEAELAAAAKPWWRFR